MAFMTFHVLGNVIIPTDELILFRGVETTKQLFTHKKTVVNFGDMAWICELGFSNYSRVFLQIGTLENLMFFSRYIHDHFVISPCFQKNGIEV
jgi:hypothetical protein